MERIKTDKETTIRKRRSQKQWQKQRRELLFQNRSLTAELNQERAKSQQLILMWQRATRWKRFFAFALFAPVDWFLGFLLIATEILLRMLRPFFRASPPVFPSPALECSFIVVSWNGRHLLGECLPALIRAVRCHGGRHEVIVVDNGSVDGTANFVEKHFPEVRIIRNKMNRPPSECLQLGIEMSSRDIVVILNNDVIVDKTFISPLMEPFASTDVFAAGSRLSYMSENRLKDGGKVRVRFNGCDFDWALEPITLKDERNGIIPLLSPHGGVAAIDRRKFAWLGQFEKLYGSCGMDDIDLSYRAWKVGWRCVLAIGSQATSHQLKPTVPNDDPIRQIVFRNQYIFIWKNITDIELLVAHFARSVRSKAGGSSIVGIGIQGQLSAWLGAVCCMPTILRRRWQLSPLMKRTDAEILDLIANAKSNSATPDVRRAS